jgi:hypothetical protein
MRCSEIRARIAILATLAVCTLAWGNNKPETSEASSKAPSKPGSVDKHYLAIISRGGSSLGAYEGGYNYYLTEWLKKNKKRFEAKIVTGTSAGSINALLAFITLADTTPFDIPENSIFYIAWSRIGFDRIRGPDTRLGFLGRLGLISVGKEFGPAQMKRADPAYDMLLGITATHIAAVNQEVTHGLDVPTVKQRFVVRGVVDAAKSWLCSNYIDPSAATETPVLPLKKHDTVSAYWNVLYNLALASVSIPGCFRPLPINHLQIVPSKLDAMTREALLDSNDIYRILDSERIHNPLNRAMLPDTLWSYLDGGIFDASPIRLAFQLANSAFEDAGGIKDVPTWSREHVDTWSGNRKPDFHYFFINPKNSIYPPLQGHWTPDPASIAEVLGNAAWDWARSATYNELFTLKEEYPTLEEKLHLSRNYYPTFSRLLNELFGFSETDIRIFDFYLGMYDAERYLSGDFLDHLSADSLQKPEINSRKFDTIRRLLDSCKSEDIDAKGSVSIDTTDSNFKRLVVLSRELYFQYWRTPEGSAQKRECAKKIIAAFLRRGPDGTLASKSLEDSLEELCHVEHGDFQAFDKLANKFFDSVGENGYVDTAARLDLALKYICKFHQSWSTYRGTKTASSPAECILSHKLPVLEHYLETSLDGCGQFLPEIVSQGELDEVRAKLDGINDSTEFDKILDCMKILGFKYTDIPSLEKEWEYNHASGKWEPLGGYEPPQCLTGPEVKSRMKSALSKLLRDYSNEPGGPELERNVVNVFGNPAIGFIDQSRPTAILYGLISAPAGGEIGLSFKSESECFRWTAAANIDSINLGKVVALGQGLGMSYEVPWYLLLGFECEVVWHPWIQCRLGFKTGPDFPEFCNGQAGVWKKQTIQNFYRRTYCDIDHKMVAEFSISLMERLRISISLASKARTCQSFLKGATPSISLGGEVFSW